MRLATLREGGKDGTLVLVARDGMRAAPAGTVAPTLQRALDDWDRTAPVLAELACRLEEGSLPSIALEPGALASPLPRPYAWLDGSAYLHHVGLVRRAHGAPLPDSLKTEPLISQGAAGRLLAPREALPLLDPSHGLDFEGEIGVILGDVPCGTTVETAPACVKLLVLINDATLRNLVPDELEKGVGFLLSKPALALSPFAVTPDELGTAWRDGRLHLRLRAALNGLQVGQVHAGREMHFSFFELIAHTARTRSLVAGTLLGSGTVASSESSEGVSCLAERRIREVLTKGRPTTPFLRAGDRVRLSMPDAEGWDVFGAIEQEVRLAERTPPRAQLPRM